MKRHFLNLIVGLGVLLATAGPAQAILIRFDPTPQTVTIGSSVDVGVVISGLGDGASPSLSSFDLDIGFDPGLLSFASVVFGDQLDISGLGSITSFDDSLSGSGILNLFELSLDSSQDLDNSQATSFTLATVTFNAIDAGTSPLNLSINALADSQPLPLGPGQLDAEVSSGSIVINRASVPEPGTLGLLALGCAGLICLGRKRGYY